MTTSSIPCVNPLQSWSFVGTTNSPKATPIEPDAELMVRVREGDDASFSILLERHRGPVLRFIDRMIHNQAVSEELAQEVFFRIYRSRATYEPKAKFTTWLFLIATRTGLNWIRDSRKENGQARLDEEVLDRIERQVADRQPTMEQELLSEVRLREIRQAIEALPPKQRAAVLMHKYQELDYRQIAEALGCTESAVKSLMFRAYAALRARLTPVV